VSASLGSTIALYAGLLGGWAAARAVRGRGRHRLQTAGLAVLEAGLIGQALLGAAVILAGRRAAEPATHAGYLVASVLVLPVALSAGAGLQGVWQTAVTAIACLAVVVVALRLQATW